MYYIIRQPYCVYSGFKSIERFIINPFSSQVPRRESSLGRTREKAEINLSSERLLCYL